MKKLLMIVLAVMIAFTMSVTVFAATETLTDEGTSDEDVVVKVLDKEGNVIGDDDDSDDDGEEDITRVYSVDVAWESLVFEYQLTVGEEDLVWDPDNHVYTVLNEETGEYEALSNYGAWVDNSRDVVVTNHSNAPVDVAIAFSNSTKTADAVHNVTATVAGADTTLATAVGTAVEDAPAVTYEVSVDGEPAQLAQFTVDTLTVTISK